MTTHPSMPNTAEFWNCCDAGETRAASGGAVRRSRRRRGVQATPATFNRPACEAAALCLGLILVFGAATLGFSAPAAGSRPNIVFILADDFGVGSVNCYHAVTNLVRTPNLDRLAREGRRFTDANAPSSVCSPIRFPTAS